MATFRTQSQILEIHRLNNDSSVRTIVYENKDLIEEVRFYISDGWNKLQAIDFVLFDEYSFKFTENESERSILKNWIINNLK